MGNLRSFQWTEVEDDDGQVIDRYPTVQGLVVNGITLGIPIEQDGDPSSAEWSDGRLPDGVCEVVGGEIVVTVDEIEEPGPIVVDWELL